MNRWYLFMVFLAFPAMILAQTSSSQYGGPNYASQPYQPAVPAPSMTTGYGGYGGGYGGGTTAAGSALNGLGSAMSAAGNMHLSNSAAALNMTQVQKNAIQNQQLGAKTYFEMRAANKKAVEAERSPRATAEQMARWARDATPKPVTPSEVDPSTGRVNWPAMLQQDSFAQQRATMDQLMAQKATYGSLSYAEQMEANKTIESMFSVLKSQIRDALPEDYMASRTFLQSLLYATSKSMLG